MSYIIFILIVSTFVVSLYGRPMGRSAQNVSPVQNQPKQVPVANELKQNAVKKLDILLESSHIDEDWYAQVNDMMFDLASLDKNLSHAYLKKIFIKTSQAPVEKSSVHTDDRIPQKYSTSSTPSSGSSQEVVIQKKNPIVAQNEIIQKLENLLHQEMVNDVWYAAANNLVVDLALIDRDLSNVYFKKILDKSAQARVVPIEPELSFKEDIPNKSVTPPAIQSAQTATKKDEIIKKLNEVLLQQNNDDAWYALVDDLVFDLALIDRNISNEYLKKIRMKKPVEKVATSIQPDKPSVVAGMQKGTPPPPPGKDMQKGTPPPLPGQAMPKGTPPASPMPGGAMAQGTPPPPPGGGMVKKGPPPAPGAMVKGGKKNIAQPSEQSPVVAIPQGPEPLSIRQLYGLRQLEKRSTQEVLKLFYDLLEALTPDRFWDGIKKKPELEWEGKIDSVKKALSTPGRNISVDINKTIHDRIAQVKIESAQQGLIKQKATEKKEEEKEQQEFSEKELIARITALNKQVKRDFKWVIRFQGDVKKLDKINHEKALEYESEFLKNLPGEKSFLPKPKVQKIEVKKELTAQESHVALIDKILNEKAPLWMIKAREPIQELYNMDSELGLKYQDKYLVEAKKVTGKEDKPFLPPKK